MANQFKWLLLLPVITLLHEGILSSSVRVERDVEFGANCLLTQQQYDFCSDGRGYCDYPGNRNGKGILKCYEGLACDAFPGVTHGYFVLTDPHDIVLGATAELTCCSGYHTEGATNIACDVNSTWATTFGTCEANDCESASNVSNGSYATPFGTTYPGVGYLTCDTGFVVTYTSLEDTFLICDENGTWVSGSATCEPVECGDPPSISNGQFNASDGTDYLSEAHLECNEYFLPGNGSLLTIVCEASGQWSTPQTVCFTPAGDCTDLQAQGATTSGVYTVTINGTDVDVLCEMEDGSMWTVIQQRVDGTVNFYRDWEAYQQGFGDLSGSFWLGLDNIHNIVGTGTAYRVKFHITDSIHGNKTATYQTFSITDESDKYRLTISGYSGDAGDSMISWHNNRQFTTKDNDNDLAGFNCAITYIGAWWYKACHRANLNGEWGSTDHGDGLNWKTTTTYYRSATYTRIQVQQTGT